MPPRLRFAVLSVAAAAVLALGIRGISDRIEPTPGAGGGVPRDIGAGRSPPSPAVAPFGDRRSILAEAPPPETEAEPTGTVEVVVLAKSVGPLAGVAVRLEPELGPPQTAETDAEGVARWLELEPGPWRLAPIEVEAYAPAAARGLDVVASETVSVQVALEPTRSIRVFVAQFDGDRAVGAQVRVEGSERSVNTDARGVASVDATEGAWIEASLAGAGSARGRVGPTIVARGFMVLRLAVPGDEAEVEGRISGRVVDDEGLPAAEVVLAALPRRGPPFSAVTDAEGRFIIPVSPGAAYRVRARAPDGRGAEAEDVPAGRSGLELVLEPGAGLEGRVLNADGGPAPFFSLRWRRGQGFGSSQRAFADPAGMFRLDHLQPGTYRVEAEVGAIGTASDPAVEVPVGGTGYVELRVEVPGRIDGVVVDEATDAPLAGAEVRLEGRLGLGPDLVTKTDASGGFVLEGIPAGRRSVSASAPGHRTRIVSGLVVASGQTTAGARIALTAAEDSDGLDLVGIGAVLRTESGALIVQEAMPGGGADAAGLEPGARIVAIDGRPIDELGFDGAIQAIRGEEGTTVQLTIDSDGSVRIVTILRRRVST